MLFPIYINHILLFICHDGISQTLLKWYSSMLPTYLHKHVTNRQTQTSLKLVFSLLLNFLKWSLPCIRHIAYPIHQTKGRADCSCHRCSLVSSPARSRSAMVRSTILMESCRSPTMVPMDVTAHDAPAHPLRACAAYLWMCEPTKSAAHQV